MKRFNLHTLQKYFLLLSIFFLGLSLIYELFFRSEMSFPEWENNIVFILDVSQSMNVADIWNDSRLNTAKRTIIDTMRAFQGNNYALNIFAGESVRILPFTTDIWLISTFLLWLDSKNLTKQGSDIDSALRVWIESFNEKQSWTVILLTDGSDDRISISNDVIQQYSQQDIKLVILWVWTQQWWYIPSNNPLSPYKIYNGEIVQSKLNRSELKNIATDFDGRYYDVENFPESESLWQNNKVENFPYIFLLFIITWILYCGTIYWTIFYKWNSYEI